MVKVRIVVAEDIECWRDLVSSIFRNEPSFEIICEVVDGLQAVLMVEELQPAIVLLDIGLPQLSGIHAAGWIRKLSPGTRILFFSEQSDVEIVRAALNLGCGYVLKSDAASDLVSAIHSAVAGKQFVSKSIGRQGLG